MIEIFLITVIVILTPWLKYDPFKIHKGDIIINLTDGTQSKVNKVKSKTTIIVKNRRPIKVRPKEFFRKTKNRPTITNSQGF